MRRFSKLFSILLVTSLAPGLAQAQSALSGFTQESGKPVLLDPASLSIGPDQDAACKSVYGIGLFDGNQKIASFAPQGTNDDACDLSRSSQEKKLLALITKAKIANKDPAAKAKQYLLLSGGSLEVVSVQKDDPSALEKKIADLEAHVRRLELESSDEFRERAAARSPRKSSH